MPDAGVQRAAIAQPSIVRHRRRQQRALDQPRVLVLARHAARRGGATPGRPRSSRLTTSTSVASSHGFCTKLLRAAAHRFDGGVDAAPAGHDDDRQRRVVRAHAIEQIEAFAARRRVARVVQIHQQQVVRLVDARGRARRPTELTRSVSKPASVEQQAQRLQDVGLVVGDEDARAWTRRRSASSRMPRHGSTGDSSTAWTGPLQPA